MKTGYTRSNTRPARWTGQVRGCSSQQQQHRIFQELFERLEVARANCSIKRAVVDRQSELHPFTNDDLAVMLCWLAGDRAHGQDGRLGRIDDRVELFDAKHAQVADGERAASVVGWLEFARVGALGQIPSFASDLAQALLVCVADDWDDQAAVRGDGYADVDVLVPNEAVLGEGNVHVWGVAQRERGGLQDHAVEGYLDPSIGSLFEHLLA